MELVKCEKSHWRRVLEIRNLTRQSFINSSLVAYEDHLKFMEKNYENYIVAIVIGEVVGFAGVVENDVRVAVDPRYQKKGIGKKLLQKIVSNFPKCEAKIDVENKASLSLFRSCGFIKKYYILNHAQSS
jgi:L-amino acid N-acyltransferase YncA